MYPKLFWISQEFVGTKRIKDTRKNEVKEREEH
jgi:hypothetical protein